MIKVRPSQVFDFDTEEHVAEGGQRAFDPSPVPTIDDRANLYLNAVYGAREFRGEEYADPAWRIDRVGNRPAASLNNPIQIRRVTSSGGVSIDCSGISIMSTSPLGCTHGRPPSGKARPNLSLRMSSYRCDIASNPPTSLKSQMTLPSRSGACGSMLVSSKVGIVASS